MFLKEAANLCRDAWIWSKRYRRKPSRTGLNPNDHEFSLWSQNGEDGIIDYIFSIIGAGNRVFVEFGFGTTENNCLRLLLQENFAGFFFDGDERQTQRFNRLGWLFPGVVKRGEAAKAYFTRENVNDIIGAKVRGEIALLSVDVDGMDFYLWEALTCVSPRMVVVEYNAAFGPDRSVTVPYEPAFDRSKKHRLGFYHGASIAAFVKLGDGKGYALVGTDSRGCNAFFVRRELMKSPLRELTPAEGYHPHAHRIARGYSTAEQWREVSGLPLVSV